MSGDGFGRNWWGGHDYGGDDQVDFGVGNESLNTKETADIGIDPVTVSVDSNTEQIISSANGTKLATGVTSLIPDSKTMTGGEYATTTHGSKSVTADLSVETDNLYDPSVSSSIGIKSVLTDSELNLADGMAIEGDAGVSTIDLETNSLEFNDDVVEIDNFTDMPSTEISISFWTKTTDDSSSAPISYAHTNSSNNELLLYGTTGLEVYIGGSSINTGVSFNDGNTHHVAMTWRSSDGQLRVYIDGVLEADMTHQSGYSVPNNGALVFGQEQDSELGGYDSSQAYYGSLDDVRLFERVLSSGDVSNLANRVDVRNGLVGHWPLGDTVKQIDDGGFEKANLGDGTPNSWVNTDENKWVVNNDYTAPGSIGTQSYGSGYPGDDGNGVGVWPDAYVYQDVDVTNPGTVSIDVWIRSGGFSDGGWTGPDSSRQYVYEDDMRVHLYYYDRTDTEIGQDKTRWAGDAYNRGLSYISRDGSWFHFTPQFTVPDGTETIRVQVDGGDANNSYIDPETGHGGNAGIWIDEFEISSTTAVDLAGKNNGTISGATYSSPIASNDGSVTSISPTISVDGIRRRFDVNKEGIGSVGQTIDSTALSTETVITPGGLGGSQTSHITTVQGSVTTSIDRSDISTVEPSPTSNTDDAFVKPLSGQINLKGYLSQATAEHAIISSVSNELVSTTEQAIGVDPVTAQTPLSNYNLHTAEKSPTTSSISTELDLDNSRIRLQEKSSVLLKSTNVTTGMSPDITNVDERQISTSKSQASVSITQDSVSSTETPISSGVGIVSTKTNAGPLDDVEFDIGVSVTPVSSFMDSQDEKVSNVEVDTRADLSTLGTLDQEKVLSLENKITSNPIQAEIDSSPGESIAIERTVETSVRTASIIQDPGSLVSSGRSHSIKALSVASKMTNESESIRAFQIGVEPLSAQVIPQPGVYDSIGANFQTSTDKTTAPMLVGPLSQYGQLDNIAQGIVSFIPDTENGNIGGINIDTQTGSTTSTINTESVISTGPSIGANPVMISAPLSAHNGLVDSLNPKINAISTGVSTASESLSYQIYQPIVKTTGFPIPVGPETVSTVEPEQTINTDDSSISPHSGLLGANGSTIKTDTIGQIPIQHTTESISVKSTSIDINPVTSTVIASPEVADNLGPVISTNANETGVNISVGKDTTNLDGIEVGLSAQIADVEVSESKARIETAPIDTEVGVSSVSLSEHNSPLSGKRVDMDTFGGVTVRTQSTMLSGVEPQPIVSTDDASIKPFADNLKATGLTIETDPIEATSNVSQETVYTRTNKVSVLSTNTTTDITNGSLDSDSFQIDLTSDITSLNPEPSQIQSEVFNIDTSASTAGFSVTNDVLTSQGLSTKLNAQATQLNPTTHNLNKNEFSPSLMAPSVVSTTLSNKPSQIIGENIEMKTGSVTGTFDIDSMEQIEDMISFNPTVATTVPKSGGMYSTGANIKTTTDVVSSILTVSAPVLVESTPTVNADDTDIGVQPENIIQYGKQVYFDTQNKATTVASDTDIKVTEGGSEIDADTVDVSPTTGMTQTDEKDIDTSVSRSVMDITEGRTDTFDPQTTVNVTRAKSVMSNEKIQAKGLAVTTGVDRSTATIGSNGVDQVGRKVSSEVDTATVVTQSPQTQIQETNLKIPVIDTVSAGLGSEEISATNVHIRTSVSPVSLFSNAEKDNARTPIIEGESQGTVQTLLDGISVDVVESNATFGLTPVSTVQSVEIPSLSEEEINTIVDSTTSSVAIDTIGDGEHTMTTDTGSSSVNANIDDVSIDHSNIQSIVDTVTASQSIGNTEIKGSLDAVYQTFLVEGLSVVIGERDRSRLLQGDYKGLAIVSGERERSRIVGGEYDRQTILQAIRDRYTVVGDR